MTPYLSTMTRLGNREVEAGARAQSDICCGMTLALTGSSQGETEPTKASYLEVRHNIKPRLHWSRIPAEFPTNIGKSPGNPVDELATQERNEQSNRGNEEKRIKGLGMVEFQVGAYEKRNSFNSGRTTRNWVEVFRKHLIGVKHD